MVYRILSCCFFVLVTFFAHATGVKGESLNPYELARYAIDENLQIPRAEEDGRIDTLNKKGAMTPHSDLITERFIQEAVQGQKKVLEIGAAYGRVVEITLSQGNRDYTVNDLDIRHLKILAKQIAQKDSSLLRYLKVIPGNFPYETTFHADTYDLILVARVFHFYSPENLQEAIKELFRILKVGGKCYVVAHSPYNKRYQAFIAPYEKAKREGHPFPGYVKKLEAYLRGDGAPTSLKRRSHIGPFMFLDADVLKHLFTEAGFSVEEALEFPLSYPSPNWQYDGRESVGLIARKL